MWNLSFALLGGNLNAATLEVAPGTEIASEFPGQQKVDAMPASSPSESRPGGAVGILIVDDHGLVREGISGMLGREKDLHVLGMADNADDGIEKAIQLRPDLVLMDIDMPGVSCFDAVRTIRSRVPDMRVILVTAHEHDEYLEQALRVKVNGFVLKTEGIVALITAIRAVMAGRIHYSPQVMNRLVVEGNEIRLDNPPKSRLSTLSPREYELLRVLAKGMSLKEAASVLGISYKTADKQKASIMAKLNIHDRVELARFAIREGLVTP